MGRRTDAGANLSAIMERRGVGVRALAADTGLSISTVRRLRRSTGEGNLGTWALVARSLGVSIGEIVGEVEE